MLNFRNLGFFSDSETKTQSQIFAGIRPKAIDQEVDWNKNETIISTTDKFGTITFANDTFIDTCEYSREELIGKPHNIIRHPDMPKIIFKVLWDNLLAGKNFHAIVKNLTKTGKYYWVITNFAISYDKDGELFSIMARRNSVPDSLINNYIAPFYKKLVDLEKIGGMQASADYVQKYLEKINKTYPEFIHDIMEESGANMDFLSDSVTFGQNPFLK